MMERFDRLSDLPDSILQHILSFVDTKNAVQCSVLSRRWIQIWKQVPVLSFRKISFRNVERVISLRSDINVWKINSEFKLSFDMDPIDRIMNYAACHDLQHLSLKLSYSKAPSMKRKLTLFGEYDDYSMFSKLVVSVSTCYQSLRVLELMFPYVNSAAVQTWASLERLKTLSLTVCGFDFDDSKDELYDPFANLPRLENLKLDRSFADNDDWTGVLKISGSQLVKLEIDGLRFSSVEISAPKLEYFRYEDSFFDGIRPTTFTRLDLPSLRHAVIRSVAPRTMFSGDRHHKQLMIEQCVDLFQGLHHVESLSLHFHSIELLIQACELMKHQSPPFKQLKSFDLDYVEGPVQLPYKVIHHFLGGSPIEEDKSVRVQKIRWFRC
ncbi:Putative F-box/LRR-repeat protein At5g02930 [Linum perenne]